MSRDALIVGVSSYQFLPSLGAPGKDAEAIAQTLESYGDFRVTRLPEIVQNQTLQVGLKTPVTLTQLETALVQLFKPKGNNIPQTALFYFSGHGLQKEAGIQEGYLATSDANPQYNFYGLSLFWLRRLLQESPVRQRIVLLDCCHSGEILNYLEADPGARSGTDRLFMAASREYESAYESLDGKYSVFTQALLDGLDPRRLANGIVSNYALTDWVSNALKGEVQQPLFENSGSEIILTRCQGTTTILQTQIQQDICPYRGLEYFDEVHADYFFGREDLTDQLVDQLKSNNFLAVLGASGSGKSSLVRAGLIHKLRRGQRLSGSDRWQIKLITPTDQPIKSLANAFISNTQSPIERAEQLKRAEVFLQDGGTGLSHLVRASLMSPKGWYSSAGSRLVLVIDQFEEVFTLCQGPQAERERHRFFNCLLTAMREVGDLLSIVVVVRADFFSKFSLYNGIAEKIEQNLVVVTPLTYDQIKASILKPAEKVGLTCDPNLVYNIMYDIAGSPGELPLLQYTLLELWQRRVVDTEGTAPRMTLDAYNDLGGVRGTLQKRANEVFYSLTEDEQQVTKRIFIALTQLGEGTEDTRRRILKSDLISAQYPAELIDRVVEKLVAAKLIVTNQVAAISRHQERTDQRMANVSTALRLVQLAQGKVPKQGIADLPPITSLQDRLHTNGVLPSSRKQLPELQASVGGSTSQETVDIAHEVLIRNWTMLRSWLDENREMLRRQRRIERAAKEWDGADQVRSAEYLFRGNHLVDAEEFLAQYPQELSTLAQHFITISQEDSRQARRELRFLQIAVPCTLLVALIVTCNQYWTALRNQAEKEYQLQISTSRQWAAIAQDILQEPEGDPSAALLISRLAAEQGKTYEAEVSLRASLQKLRLQAELHGHHKVVQQLAFNPQQHLLATASADGTIRLWSLDTQSELRTLRWQDGDSNGSTSANDSLNLEVAFTADGKRLVAIAHDSATIKVWTVESGQLQWQLTGLPQAITHLSVQGNTIAAAADKTVMAWQAETGKLQGQWQYGVTVRGLDLAPDGQAIVVSSGFVTQVQPTQPGKAAIKLSHPQAIQQSLISRNGQIIATISSDRYVRLWNRTTGNLVALWQASTAIRRLRLSPDGSMVAITNSQRQVMLWKPDTSQSWLVWQPPTQMEDSIPLSEIAFSQDGQTLVVTQPTLVEHTWRQKIQLWDVAQQRTIAQWQAHTQPIHQIAWSLDDTLVVTAAADGSVRLWSATPGGEFPTLKMAQTPIQWVTFGMNRQLPPAKSTLAAYGSSSPLAAFDGVLTVATNGTFQRWQFHPHPMGETAAANSLQLAQSAMVTQPSPKSPWQILQEFGQNLWMMGTQVTQPALPDLNTDHQQHPTDNTEPNQILPTALPTMVSGSLTGHLPPGARLVSVAFSRNGQVIATSDSFGGLALWQVLSDQGLQSLRRIQPSQLGRTLQVVRNLTFSPDGRFLLGLTDDHQIRVWDAATGQLRQKLQGHKATIDQAQFSPDSQLIISAAQDKTVRIWERESGQQRSNLLQTSGIGAVAFSPDGQRIVVATLNGTASIYERSTGDLKVILAGHRGALLDVGFSPDGQLLVTASADGTARVWDTATGLEKASLRSAQSDRDLKPLRRAFFSPDGQYVATLTNSGELQLWVATWERLMQLAQERSLRPLQPEECLRYLRLPPTACPALTIQAQAPSTH